MIGQNYIYQTIHTLAHHPLSVSLHCRIAERHFLDTFFRPLRLDDESIHNEIVELLRRERVTRELSVFVELRIDIEGEIELTMSGVSLYDGYAMRSISPRVQAIVVDSPFGLMPNSARRETIDFANEIARNLGAEMALECDTKGVVHSLGGTALFGVVGRRIIASRSFDSVERRLVIEAAEELNLEVEQRYITRVELHQLDELFGVDHQGVIAASSYGDHLYMKIMAEKIASRLLQPFF